MIGLGIEVTGQEKVFIALGEVAEHVLDFEREREDYGHVLREHVGQQYGSEGAQSGGWQSLSEAYAARKAKTYPGKGIERASDKTFKSLTEDGAEGSILQASHDGLTFGSSVPQAVFQQVGTDNMPARQLIVVTNELGEKLLRVAQVKAALTISAAGFETGAFVGLN